MSHPSISEYRKFIRIENNCAQLQYLFPNLEHVKYLAKKGPDDTIRNFFTAFLRECEPYPGKKYPCPKPKKSKRRSRRKSKRRSRRRKSKRRSRSRKSKRRSRSRRR